MPLGQPTYPPSAHSWAHPMQASLRDLWGLKEARNRDQAYSPGGLCLQGACLFRAHVPVGVGVPIPSHTFPETQAMQGAHPEAPVVQCVAFHPTAPGVWGSLSSGHKVALKVRGESGQRWVPQTLLAQV